MSVDYSLERGHRLAFFCIIFIIFVGVSKYNLYVCKERMIENIRR